MVASGIRHLEPGVKVGRPRGQGPAGVRLRRRRETVEQVAARFGALAFDPAIIHVPPGVGDRRTIVAAPGAVAQVAKIGFAPCAVGKIALQLVPLAIPGKRDLAVLVKGDHLRFPATQSKSEVRLIAHARLRTSVSTRLIPYNVGIRVFVDVRECDGILVIVSLGFIHQEHVAPIGTADIANITVMVAYINGFRAAAEFMRALWFGTILALLLLARFLCWSSRGRGCDGWGKGFWGRSDRRIGRLGSAKHAGPVHAFIQVLVRKVEIILVLRDGGVWLRSSMSMVMPLMSGLRDSTLESQRRQRKSGVRELHGRSEVNRSQL